MTHSYSATYYELQNLIEYLVENSGTFNLRADGSWVASVGEVVFTGHIHNGAKDYRRGEMAIRQGQEFKAMTASFSPSSVP